MPAAIKYKLGSIEDLKSIETAGAALFDHHIKKQQAIEFLEDPRHHIILAYLSGTIIGMATAVHYLHPDKKPQLFINEVSVLEDFRNQGIGRELVKKICAHGKTLKCTEAWLGVESSNTAARKAYLGAGGIEEEPVVMVNFK